MLMERGGAEGTHDRSGYRREAKLCRNRLVSVVHTYLLVAALQMLLLLFLDVRLQDAGNSGNCSSSAPAAALAPVLTVICAYVSSRKTKYNAQLLFAEWSGSVAIIGFWQANAPHPYQYVRTYMLSD